MPSTTTGSSNVLWELKTEIPVGDVESVDAVLLDRGDERWSVFHDVIGGRAWIIGIFGDEKTALAAWNELSPQLAGVACTERVIRELPSQDWRDSYKAHFHAWKFGRLHWAPVWERETYRVPSDDVVLWLDPGLAFGTGNHETTRLCVERLVEHAARGNCRGKVVDAGCGSGILALSAARLGYGDVFGFDNDPEAIRVSVENAVANDLRTNVRFQVEDLVTGLAAGEADILLANILANVLIRFAGELTRAINPGGWLVLSGILQQEREQVLQAFLAIAPDWVHSSRVMGDWSDVVLIRPAHP